MRWGSSIIADSSRKEQQHYGALEPCARMSFPFILSIHLSSPSHYFYRTRSVEVARDIQSSHWLSVTLVLAPLRARTRYAGSKGPQ